MVLADVFFGLMAKTSLWSTVQKKGTFLKVSQRAEATVPRSAVLVALTK